MRYQFQSMRHMRLFVFLKFWYAHTPDREVSIGKGIWRKNLVDKTKHKLIEIDLLEDAENGILEITY